MHSHVEMSRRASPGIGVTTGMFPACRERRLSLGEKAMDDRRTQLLCKWKVD
jgi:hypothetical protein